METHITCFIQLQYMGMRNSNCFSRGRYSVYSFLLLAIETFVTWFAMFQSETQLQKICAHLNVFLKAARFSCSHNVTTVVIIEMTFSLNSDDELKMQKQM